MPDDHPTHPTPRPTAGHSPAISPMPISKDAADILLVGGSFDPPTNAHARIATAARAAAADVPPQHSLIWLVFVPAARSPFKPDPPEADAHRAAMLRLVADGLPHAAVWTDELDRAAEGTPSYWIDTLRRARTLRPEARLSFLIGADQAAEFHRWREAHEIIQLARPLVVLREPWSDAAALLAHLRQSGAWSDTELATWQGAMLPIPTVRGSSTEARAALAATPRDAETLDRLLDPAVLEYIVANRLYQPRAGSD